MNCFKIHHVCIGKGQSEGCSGEGQGSKEPTENVSKLCSREGTIAGEASILYAHFIFLRWIHQQLLLP